MAGILSVTTRTRSPSLPFPSLPFLSITALLPRPVIRNPTGKTTLVDKILSQSEAGDDEKVTTLGDQVEKTERLMDSGDLEKERGITIMSKATRMDWQGHQLNIVDTPGHQDFGGEVERVLSMVEAAVLLVDATEGVMSQTKFVVSKALEQGLHLVVVLNKMDRTDTTQVRRTLAPPHSLPSLFDCLLVVCDALRERGGACVMCNVGCDDQLNAAFLLMVFKPPLMIRIATDLRRLVLSRCTSHARLREERIEAVCLLSPKRGCDDQLNAAFLLMVFKPPLMIRIATDLRRLVLSRTGALVSSSMLYDAVSHLFAPASLSLSLFCY